MGITDARAQTPPKKDEAAKKGSHWVFGATYLGNDVYLGRRDSVAIPYFTPSIKRPAETGSDAAAEARSDAAILTAQESSAR